MKTNILILSFLLFCSSAFSQVIRVPEDQATIQAGINAANNGDTVLVSPGTYFENINLKGKNIVLGSHFITTGDLTLIGSTVINGSNPVHADTASCILIINREDSTCVVAGFTITGGKGTRWEDEHGRGNWYTEGGGILIQYSAPTIRNNIIIGNEAIKKGTRIVSAGGGAIRCGDGNPHILNNMIISNKGLYGGGIVLNYSGAVIRNNIIAKNSGGQDFGGGGIWFNGNGTKPKYIENNTIIQNSSTSTGGGVEGYANGTANFVNNIIYGNSAQTGPQIHGSPKVTYCDVQGGFTGTGNFDDNPRFTDALYMLPDNSHCIDAGNPDARYNDAEDIQNAGQAKYPSKGTVRNDMGAYGGPGAQELPEPNTSGIAEFYKSVDFKVYPNPATDLIHIELPETLPAGSLIRIISMTGKTVLVCKLVDTGGPVDISLEGLNLPAGLYSVSLAASGLARQSERIIVISELPVKPGN
ncbi:MAG: T9SS type A sorting domain-containing protein [Bacteroidota bacterium]